jgi:alpha-L-arabinofuranosidase
MAGENMKARIKIDLERQIGTINANIYGQFMCRRPGCSEGGLYAPDSTTADEHGLRRAVVDGIADLKPPLIRWPGGCTGTSYHWMDGIGPVEQRPRQIDLHFGWEARYEFGTDEFVDFCRRIGTEPHLNFAMGTGTLEEAAAWVEYCNGTTNTTYANLRRQYGHEQPHNVKYWQLGNEMYGPWEIGHSTPAAYAVEAREWAKTVRRVDRDINIIAVGGGSDERTLAPWAWEVVPEVAPYVDYISFHTYWAEKGTGDPWHEVLSGPYKAEAMIDTLSAIIQLAQRTDRRARQLGIAITEWNAAPRDTMMGHHPEFKPFGPTYSLRDALAVASFINIMQRHCREVTLATVAQSINVVGLIMVNGENVWREPIYWPLWMQVRYSGPIALDALVETETFDEPSVSPTIRPERQHLDSPITNMPYMDCSASFDPQQGKVYLSLVNQHPSDSVEVHIELPGIQVNAQGTIHELYHDNAESMNTPQSPDTVKPTSTKALGFGAQFVQELKPHAYTIIELDLQ